MAPAAMAGCEMPNAAGTVVLPDPNCPYLSPDDFHMVVDGLPPGTTIVVTGIHRDFLCGQGGIPGTCATPDSSGGETEVFDSILEMQMEGTGALAGFQRTLLVQVQCVTHTDPRTPGDAVQSFDTEMVHMLGAVAGDPDFDFFGVRAGSNFGLPSPGHTTLTRLGPPGSNFAVDSFFDITYEIEFQGAPGSALHGLAGTTQGTVHMVIADGGTVSVQKQSWSNMKGVYREE
jgi:hypothetical protein